MALWLADKKMRHMNRLPNAVKLNRAQIMRLKNSFSAFLPDSHLCCSSVRWGDASIAIRSHPPLHGFTAD